MKFGGLLKVRFFLRFNHRVIEASSTFHCKFSLLRNGALLGTRICLSSESCLHTFLFRTLLESKIDLDNLNSTTFELNFSFNIWSRCFSTFSGFIWSIPIISLNRFFVALSRIFSENSNILMLWMKSKYRLMLQHSTNSDFMIHDSSELRNDSYRKI